MNYQHILEEIEQETFNSLVQLEYKNGIPRNPFINAGAIVVMDALISHFRGDYLALAQLMKNFGNFENDVTYGNSHAGTLALQMFTSKSGLSIF